LLDNSLRLRETSLERSSKWTRKPNKWLWFLQQSIKVKRLARVARIIMKAAPII
jgi:hypothetical protein